MDFLRQSSLLKIKLVRLSLDVIAYIPFVHFMAFNIFTSIKLMLIRIKIFTANSIIYININREFRHLFSYHLIAETKITEALKKPNQLG